jgi:phage baseplate assembly protein W
MAIKIANLEQIADQFKRKDFVFKDLQLDFKKSGSFSAALQRKIEGNDIEVDYDERAIKNSLKNLFNTRPGQRFLFPLYGLDLYQYLFEAITEENGQLIGEKIVTSIENFEPRVRIQQCNVVAKPDDNEYEITIIVSIPVFNTTASINTILDAKTQTFVFLETSRNR